MSDFPIIETPAGPIGYGKPSLGGQDFTFVTSGVDFSVGDETDQVWIATAPNISATLRSAAAAPGDLLRVSCEAGPINILRAPEDGGGLLFILYPGYQLHLVSTGVSGSGPGQGWAVTLGSETRTSVVAFTGSTVLASTAPQRIIVDPDAASATLEMPPTVDVVGRPFLVTNLGDGVQLLSIVEAGPGATIAALRAGESIEIIANDGGGWDVSIPPERIGVQTMNISGGDVTLGAAAGSRLFITNGSGGNRNVDMPPPSSCRGQMNVIRVTGVGAGDTVTFRQNDAAPIDGGVVLAGATTHTLILVCDGALWRSMGAYVPIAGSF